MCSKFIGYLSLFVAMSICCSAKSDNESTHNRMISAIDDAWKGQEEIVFRSYKLDESLSDLIVATANDSISEVVSANRFFKTVDFPNQTSAMLMQNFNSLFVYQTIENITKIEKILASYSEEQASLEPRQVEIEVKILEVSHNTLNELGFNWTLLENKGGNLALFDNLEFLNTTSEGQFPSIDPNSTQNIGQSILGSGLRSAAGALGAGNAGQLAISRLSGDTQWNLIIKAMEQAGDSEVLSSPKIVTLDGNTATIKVGEERMIPKEFEINNSETSPYVEHSNWDLELMGVHLEVTPELREDGFIDLELHPKITDIIGYDTYAIMPDYEYSPGAEHGIQPNGSMPTFNFFNGIEYISVNTADEDYSLTASLPYFRIREIETRVTVSDGNTIGMGGLIYDKSQSFNDAVPLLSKIPFIGRLFRSEGERSLKRNLMIFVKASTVDLDGAKSTDIAKNK